MEVEDFFISNLSGQSEKHQHKYFILMVIILIRIAGTCFGAMDTFLFWLLQDMGASKSLMGLTLTVGSVCSLPILLFASPIIDTLGSVNTIVLGFSFYVVRFIGKRKCTPVC